MSISPELKEDISQSVIECVKRVFHDEMDDLIIPNGDVEVRLREKFESFHDAEDILEALKKDKDFMSAIQEVLEDVTWKEPI